MRRYFSYASSRGGIEIRILGPDFLSSFRKELFPRLYIVRRVEESTLSRTASTRGRVGMCAPRAVHARSGSEKRSSVRSRPVATSRKTAEAIATWCQQVVGMMNHQPRDVRSP